MPRIYFVRHGKAAAGFSEDRDPGLNELGHAQAAALVERFSGLPPLELITSPMRRARETAVPVERFLQQHARIIPAVAEIPSPVADLSQRGAWLRTAMAGNWADLPSELQVWRQGVVNALLALSRDSIIFSHFIAINAAVTHALDDPRMVCFSPENCSVTILDSIPGSLRVVELGEQANTVAG